MEAQELLRQLNELEKTSPGGEAWTPIDNAWMASRDWPPSMIGQMHPQNIICVYEEGGIFDCLVDGLGKPMPAINQDFTRVASLDLESSKPKVEKEAKQ